MHRHLVAAFTLALALALASCGGGGGNVELHEGPGLSGASDANSAQLWVTRDEGSEVILTATVPAGLTVIQALDQQADIQTRYGGRFVQAIEGIEGSLARQQDWFYFLNGIEPDVGAAEIRLRPGDIAWWDFRSWATEMEAPIVVGAFPEPFLHGFDGHVRPVTVRAPAELADAAAALEALFANVAGEGEPNLFVLKIRDDLTGASLRAERGSANDAPVRFVLSGSLETVRAAALTLARTPDAIRYRYRVSFDDQGRVLP